jgi:hypothetical protein
MIRRAIAATALAGLLVLPAAGTVLGHECYIISRSDTGDAHAANSKAWDWLTLHDVFAFILPAVTGGPSLTPGQIDWALQQAAAQGIPNAWVTRADKTIGAGSSNPNLANGKGLDHLADVYGAQLGAIYFAALQH